MVIARKRELRKLAVDRGEEASDLRSIGPLTTSIPGKRELPSNHKGVENNRFPTRVEAITKQRVTKLNRQCKTMFSVGGGGGGGRGYCCKQTGYIGTSRRHLCGILT